MNQYEAVFILTPVLSEAQMKEAVKDYEKFIKADGFLLDWIRQFAQPPIFLSQTVLSLTNSPKLAGVFPSLSLTENETILSN